MTHRTLKPLLLRVCLAEHPRLNVVRPDPAAMRFHLDREDSTRSDDDAVDIPSAGVHVVDRQPTLGFEILEQPADVLFASGAAPPALDSRCGEPIERRKEGSKQPGAMKQMLAQWNQALPGLRNALSERDDSPDTTAYGTALKKSDRVQIPERDMPSGAPDFMLSLDQWASREDLLPKTASKKQKAEAKRATVVVKIPPQERPWKPLDQ